MFNSISKILAALLAVMLLYLVPAMQQAQRQEDISLLEAYNSLTEFVDSVRNKGYISPVMYEDFRRSLGGTGEFYEVELEHRHKTYHPEYADPADKTTFQQDYSIHYESHYTDELERTIFPEKALSREDLSRKYKMEAGDYFTVSIHRKGLSPLTVLTNFLYNSAQGADAGPLHYGGMVLNEDY
ncbi:hypothetical protein [Paenibacillus sp. J22TS3]|uniref:hypothetical protein n=1 Tax=Paenibacillus sp. J22TS3 TaxID=2807192 RepID=UPI001B0FCBD0|nr:hypothetical protein [Paenibacillus sp. J22TS3]GIP19918.1 hypothetical protein J22TS3_01930 [Paenibacillus sp. J22TS3]